MLRFLPALLACSASLCSANDHGEDARWRPSGRPSWQIQFSGAMDWSLPVDIYDVDMEETSAEQIAALRRRGVRVICYISAGSVENWRSDAGSFPSEVIGKTMENWAGERWLDVRKIETLRTIMGARMDRARANGCDAIDPDNMDGYQADTGFSLTLADQIRYSTMLANEAHARGLAIGLKNGLEQVSSVVNLFDFEINEQCFQYNECHYLRPFIEANKPVFSIEYQGDRATICEKSRKLGFQTLFKELALNAERYACP